MSKNVIKQVKVNKNAYVVGDNKLVDLLKKNAENSGAKGWMDAGELESKISQMIEKAQENAKRIEHDAYERGFQKGLEDGIRASNDESERIRKEAVAEAEKIRIEIENAKKDLLKNIEIDIVDLVLKIARKIIKDCVDEKSKATVIALVKDALCKVDDREEVKIRVNPNNIEDVEKHKEDIISDIDGVRNVQIEGDKNIPKGNCVVETNCGTVDACVDTQMQTVENTFKGMTPK